MIVVLQKLKSIQKSFFCIAIMLAFFSTSVFAQTKTVSGKVTDASGKPLGNVTVLVKGAGIGTATKDDGTYSINVPPSAKQIEFSILGYEPQLVTIGGRAKISPALVSSVKVLEDVVITGISRISKSKFAGAASKVSGKELENRPLGSFDQMLQGRVPGVLSLTGSGQPGEASNIIIRGQNSVLGGSTPLYIVDGIPVEASVFQGFNPNDFSSIDILRDAATQALYGSRGSAGIIVVTTRRGVAGKFKLGYSVQLGVKSKPEFAFRPMNTTELLKAQHDYGKIVGGAANANEQIPGWYYSADNPRVQSLPTNEQTQSAHLLDSISGINSNWYNEFFRRGNFSNHEITLSGGNDKTRFYSSLAYYTEQGIINPSDMKRVTFRNNIDFSDDKFTLALSTNIGYTRRNFDPNFPGFITQFNSFLIPAIETPYSVVHNPDGSYAAGSTTSDIGGSKYVAAQFLDVKSKDKTYNNQLKATIGLNLSYKISPYVSAGINVSADFRETQNTAYNNREAFIRQPGPGQTPTTVAGSESESINRFLTSDIRPSLTFAKTFREKHDVEVSAYGEYVQENNRGFGVTGYGVDPRTPDNIGIVQQGNAANQLYSNVTGNRYTDALVSGLALLRYTYAGKYTFTGSYRRDGSSILPKVNRWTGFYSLGGVWDITKEKFAKGSRFVNALRMKLSYGGSGNANNFPAIYFYQATYGTGSYSGLPTQVVDQPGNPDAKWETSYTLNLGLDYELWNRRLYGDINLYDKRTKDLYITRQLDAESGGFSVPVNAGTLQNKGIEWNFNVDVIRNRDLTITLFSTGSYNKNKLLSIGGEQPYSFGTSFLEVGLPLGSQYTVKWGGVDAATGQPLYYDLNGKLTNLYNASNSVAKFGTWESPWKGGFGTNIKFKDIELSVLFSWQHGAVKSDNLEYFTENPVGFLASGFNQSADLHFWQQPGDVTNTPSPNYGTNFSSKLLHDASFVRFRDLKLSYTFPRSLMGHSKFISAAKFYVQGSNLFIWTKWRGLDAEAGAVNITLGEFPNPRAFTTGLNITF